MTNRDIQNSEPLLKPDHLLRRLEDGMIFMRSLMEQHASLVEQSTFMAEALRKIWIDVENSHENRLEDIKKDS